VNALANDEVGKYLNSQFVSTFQKVGTFSVAGGQKQGGNVASYFCTPDGGILGAIAGPVNAETVLREARWVVETRKMALLESRGNVARYKQVFRMAHVEELPHNAAVSSVDWARLPYFPPTAAGMTALLQRQPLAQSLDKQGRIHLLLALYPLVKLDQAYKVIYDDIVGEQISTRPVADGTTPSASIPARPSWSPVATAPGPSGSPLDGLGSLTAEERQEQARLATLRHACTDAAATEVRSGRVLNVILDDLSRRPAEAGTADDSPALAADVLAHLNVTTDAGGANFGLLRDGGRLRWALPWEDAALDEPSQALRQSVESGIREALTQAKDGRPAARTLSQLRSDVQGLDDLLGQKVRDLSPSDYISAKDYLKQLDAAVRMLGRDDVAQYLSGGFTLDPKKIRTVRGLVAFMGDHGLKFAAAVEGDESAYATLHRALASYDQKQAPPESALDRGAL
jgi:hypothetical protein